MSDPKTLEEIMSTMGWVPTFLPCKTCGGLTSGGGECFDCDRRRHASADARRSYLETVPEAFRWASCYGEGLDLLRARVARFEQASVIAASQSRKLVLVGRSGAGKTSLAVALGRMWVLDNAQAARFVLATDLATARRRSPLGRESPEVYDAMTAPMLILDDLGTEQVERDGAVVETVFKRHGADRPTWVTTWLAPEAMAERYGEGFARRVYQGARVVQL